MKNENIIALIGKLEKEVLSGKRTRAEGTAELEGSLVLQSLTRAFNDKEFSKQANKNVNLNATNATR